MRFTGFSLGCFINAEWMGPLFININVSSRKKSLYAGIYTYPFNITKTGWPWLLPSHYLSESSRRYLVVNARALD